jgi:hypothetical protein
MAREIALILISENPNIFSQGTGHAEIRSRARQVPIAADRSNH